MHTKRINFLLGCGVDLHNCKVKWFCKCDCGNEKIISSSHLLGDNKSHKSVKSCGCLLKEVGKRQIKHNSYDLSGQYGIGYTENNEEFYFDLEDYDKIKNYFWKIENGYVIAYDRGSQHKKILMHNLILNHKGVDHIGGSMTKHDNRKQNLRIPPDDYSFETYNKMNQKISSNNKSGHTGVYLYNNKWRAQIGIDKKIIYLGQFSDYESAVNAREKAEEKYYGEYSYNNSQAVYQQLNSSE